MRDSLKWLLLILLVTAFIAGAWLGLRTGTARLVRQEALAVTPTPAPSPSPTSTPAPTPTPSPSPVPADAMETWLVQYIANMSIEEKLGQMVLFGFSGTDAPGDAFLDLMKTNRVGNLILYGANVASGDRDGGFSRCAGLVEAATAEMTTEIPPLVAIDVEGGSVVRFTWDAWPASARTLGQRNDTNAAKAQFATIGSALVTTGVNTNLAPVLDVALDPAATFLGTRIISSDADVAAAIGTAVVDGLHEAGCLSTAKHFPGHGGTTKDSHDETPVIRKTKAELDAYDLVPFRAAIDAGVDAILVTHILFPALDETDIASLSKPVITDLLRQELGFSGIVMSDDFRMGGLTNRYDVSEAAVRFVLAGGDVIMCGAQPDKQKAILAGLSAAAADGTLAEARIDESVARILRAKLSNNIWTVSFSA